MVNIISIAIHFGFIAKIYEYWAIKINNVFLSHKVLYKASLIALSPVAVSALYSVLCV